MSAYVDLAGELVNVGRNDLKLCEVDMGEAITREKNVGRNDLKLCEVGMGEAITREKLMHRNNDDVRRFSVRIISEIIDEFDVIAAETGDSLTKIASGVVLHGLSIMWDIFEKRLCGTYSRSL
jgi:hypothetical protein